MVAAGKALTLGLGAALLAAGALLGALPAAGEAVDAEGQRVTIALAQEPPQLSSMKATDQVSIMVLGHVMEGLVRYDSRGRIVPGVAERWELDDTGARFWLRKDAEWSDGSPLVAADFVFAWRKALEPATGSEYAFILYAVKNAEKVNKGQAPVAALGVSAPDDHRLHVEFERPTAHFLKLAAFATYLPVQQAFFEARGERYGAEASDLLYNGPFAMTEWVHGASLRLAKNQRYWNRDAVKLNGIHADYITSDTRALLNLFVDGKIAYVGLDGETYKDALALGHRIRRFSTGAVFFLEYNHRPGRPTANRSLRRALQLVFDPHELVNQVLGTPGNLPGLSLFPAWLDGVAGKFRDEYPPPVAELSLTEARRHLELAKQELGLAEIPPLALLVGDSPTARKQAEYFQGLLGERLGLAIKIDVQTFKQRLAKMTSGDFDLVGAGWGPDFDDILTFGDLYASWNLNNRGRYRSPAYDRLVRTAMNSLDPRTRMDAMGQAQQILFDDAVLLPLYEQGVIYLQHPQLKGVVRRRVGADPDFAFARVQP